MDPEKQSGRVLRRNRSSIRADHVNLQLRLTIQIQIQIQIIYCYPTQFLDKKKNLYWSPSELRKFSFFSFLSSLLLRDIGRLLAPARWAFVSYGAG